MDMIYADAWRKRREWKRRFVQGSGVGVMARVLNQDGEFRFVSDIADYCAWTLMHLSRSSEFVWTAERADDWRQPWSDYTMTRYGAKAEREGRRAAYLRFRRIGLSRPNSPPSFPPHGSPQSTPADTTHHPIHKPPM